jgi:chromosomal replication initiation ATPase DnaA
MKGVAIMLDPKQQAEIDARVGELVLPGPFNGMRRAAVIASAVRQSHSLTADEFFGATRRREVNDPRQIAFELIHAYAKLNFVEIGRLFGGRHHSTIMHGLKQVENLAAADPAYRKQLDDWRHFCETELEKMA